MRIVVVVLMAIFCMQANASTEDKKYSRPITDPHRFFDSWTVFYVKNRGCSLTNFYLENYPQVKIKQKNIDWSKHAPFGVFFLHNNTTKKLQQPSVHVRWSIGKPEIKTLYRFVKEISFSIDEAKPYIFTTKFRPHQFAFLTPGYQDNLLTDMKKGLRGQVSGSLITHNKKEFFFKSNVDLRGFTKAFKFFEKCNLDAF